VCLMYALLFEKLILVSLIVEIGGDLFCATKLVSYLLSKYAWWDFF